MSRALADAVERHATMDPIMRDILKRASIVCHPESELQKIAVHTEDSIPYPSVTYGGSASGAQPGGTTSTDQNTGTDDVTYAGCDSNTQE